MQVIFFVVLSLANQQPQIKSTEVADHAECLKLQTEFLSKWTPPKIDSWVLETGCATLAGRHKVH